MPTQDLLVMIGSLYIAKVVYEVLLTPITYLIVNRLKRAEGVDVYDIGVRYNPFRIE